MLKEDVEERVRSYNLDTEEHREILIPRPVSESTTKAYSYVVS